VTRLRSIKGLPPSVQVPRHDRSAAAGIVHLGVGAFHKAHQAVYTDEAMARSGGDWMIDGVSLRSPDAADALNPQDGLYTLLTHGTDGVSARVIGSIRRVIVAGDETPHVFSALAQPTTRIVSLTITEKGYGLDPKTGGLDRNHPAIAADLADSNNTQSALGFIVGAIHVRRMLSLPPFTVLCCDNLPSNGKLLKRLVLEFAALRDPAMVAYIEKKVRFPSTMVDRITPAATEATLADAERLIGRRDLAAVETEPFSQWIIEDDFASGRPDWAAAGALFVRDVAPYEKMKLRMLNGTHSMLAYAGFLAGHAYVRDAMADAALARLARRHMQEAARTLDPVPGIDLDRYADDLVGRFANPAIAHQTYQIAMDGTQKLPQRLLEAATVALKRGLPLDTYAFAVATWMRYALGRKENGETYALRDPREAEIVKLMGSANEADAIVERLLGLPGLFPAELVRLDQWRGAVSGRLKTMLGKGMRAAIGEEAAPTGP
jgi:fructuronate reductase